MGWSAYHGEKSTENLGDFCRKCNPFSLQFWPATVYLGNTGGINELRRCMRKLSLFPEKGLLNRIKNRDRTVLGELFTRYAKMVRGYVVANGGHETDADDLLQEAIIVLWQNVCSGRFELTSKVSTYVMGIVKNTWRAEQRRRRRLSSETDGDREVDDRPSGLDALINAEKVEAVRQALNCLKPVCRELLMLFYFEERSLRDIARIMGFANADVVKAKKYQCKKALAALLRQSDWVSSERKT